MHEPNKVCRDCEPYTCDNCNEESEFVYTAKISPKIYEAILSKAYGIGGSPGICKTCKKSKVRNSGNECYECIQNSVPTIMLVCRSCYNKKMETCLSCSQKFKTKEKETFCYTCMHLSNIGVCPNCHHYANNFDENLRCDNCRTTPYQDFADEYCIECKAVRVPRKGARCVSCSNKKRLVL